MTTEGTAAPELGAAVSVLFGEHRAQAERYAELLATSAVERGLIGPREVPRLWPRHLLNCAAVAELIPDGSSLVDVGSGAGLPGLVLAIARPDLTVTLLEPLQRRASWLEETVSTLGLVNVVVRRGRAEAEGSEGPGRAATTGEPLRGPGQSGVDGFDVVTARAVAPLDTLARWCLPLARPAGLVLAIKGSGAAAEVEAAEPVLRGLGAVRWSVMVVGRGLIEEPTTVVAIEAGPRSGGRAGSGQPVRRRVSGRRRGS